MPPEVQDRIVLNIRWNRIINICTLVSLFGGGTWLGLSKANSILTAIQDNTRQTMELRKEVDALKITVNEHDKSIAFLNFKNK
jgi:hypothetical protein